MDGSSDFDQIVVISNFNFVSEKNSLIWGTNLESGRAGLLDDNYEALNSIPFDGIEFVANCKSISYFSPFFKTLFENKPYGNNYY